VAGTIETGSVRAGDKVIFLPRARPRVSLQLKPSMPPSPSARQAACHKKRVACCYSPSCIYDNH
jgi:MOSC domain-containing protein YiiM